MYYTIFLILSITVAFNACDMDDGESDKCIDYKFWTFESSKVCISDCGEDEDIDLPDEIWEDIPEIAFAPNGNVIAKDGGVIYDSYSDWRWSDENKSGIILDKYPDVVFKFTAFNEKQVVYAGIQTVSDEGCDCRVITYEVLYL